ncbi:MAG: hypothetical protein ACRC8K_03505 [Waterburya sp.]
MKQASINHLPAPSLEDKYHTDFPAILDMEIIRRNALDAIASNERIQAYALFEIYAKSQETLTDQDIQELIGFKPPRTGYKYERYKFIRYSRIDVMGDEGKLKKQDTWLIEKFDPVVEAKARQAKRQIKVNQSQNLEVLTLEDFDLDVDEGLENYHHLKKVMAEA